MPALVADHLRPFRDLIAGARTFRERAGALWAATVHVVHRQTQSDRARLIVAYEWLCADPVPRLQDLYQRLDMTWTPAAERFVRTSDAETDGRTYSLRRRTAAQIDES